MPKKLFDFAEARATGLTGTNGVEFNPFSFAGYGFTNTVKIMIEYDAVALRDNENTTGAYSEAYSSKAIYTFNPSTGNHALVVNHVQFSDSGEIAWFVTTGPKLRAQGNPIAAGRSFDIGFAARMKVMVER